MRIATSALLGMTLTLSSLSALAQAQPQPPAVPLPVQPPAPPAQPPPDTVAQPAQPPAPPDAAPAPLPPAPAPADAPPAPPPPGAAASVEVPPPPPPIFQASDAPPVTERLPLAGWHGSFFLRDPNDYFRLYPRGRLQLDFHGFFGPGVSDVKAEDGGNALKARFFVRRLRLELAGEFLKRWSFNITAELGGQPIANVNGKSQTAAASAGADPTAESARWAGVQTASASGVIADGWINYSVFPAVNFMLGQYNAPFTMENRTSNNILPFMERNLAIRGFAFPNNKEIGLMAWGEISDRMFNYELGVFAGDGQNRPQIDNRADVMGRIFVRPFAGDKNGPLAKAHIGVSGMHGERDQAYVGYGYQPIRTGHGFTLWDPRYKDSLGRNISVIPSGAQNAFGGELRLPISRFELRGEAYYVANDTREAVEGYQLTNTERLGQVSGLGWYVQLSAWPLGDAFVNGDPGFARPTKVDFSKEPEKPKKGLEILAIIAGVNASYDGASREGEYDDNTPGGAGGVGTNISLLQIGGGLNYWHTKHVRATIDYMVYQAPGSGDPAENLAVVPGNLLDEPDLDAHVIHELGTRLAVYF